MSVENPTWNKEGFIADLKEIFKPFIGAINYLLEQIRIITGREKKDKK